MLLVMLQFAGEHRYHPECFKCFCCRVFIGDGETYALVERSRLYWYRNVLCLCVTYLLVHDVALLASIHVSCTS